MRRLFIMLTIIMMGSLVFAEFDAASITPQLKTELIKTTGSDLIRINISMKEKFDSGSFVYSTRGLSKQDKRDFVTSELKSFSKSSQQNVLRILSDAKKQNQVRNVIGLWINNVINCEATPEVITQLSQRSDIRSIDLDEKRKMVIENDTKKTTENSPGREITWNVTHVDANDVWALGYTGTGVMVAVLDSGVRYTHVDLADHMWDGSGAGYPNHGYDFANSDNDPMDDHSHGTHCAGTVAGDGTYASQTGMAPDATIMALKVLDATGNGTESGTWNAIQFSVDNGADIMSMSIGWQHSWGVDREGWRDAMNNAVAAGVIAAVAAGNEGDDTATYPIPDNVRSPGDVPPPWLNPDQTLVGGTSAVVCVGATDSNDDIAYFSSLGPVDWSAITNYNDYAYNPGIGLIRPDLSAPGMNIKSLDYGSDTGYADGWNGTSMATPCVAGVMALMVQKNPNITPVEISQILETTVDIPQSPKNNTFGSGRVNALSAVNAVSSNGEPLCSITNPSNNEVIEIGTVVNITVAASDPSRSVSNVKIYVDDVLKVTDTSSPYQYSWNTTGETLDFHTIKATATDNEAYETDHEITVRISNPVFTIFEDGFETDLGWTLTGEFERDAPTGNGGTNYGNPDPATAYSGSNILGVDLTGLGTNTYDYEPSLADRAYSATSPVIDCTDYTNVSLSFFRWLNVEQPTYDHAYIDVSTDGFSTHTNVWSNSATMEESSWSQINNDISAVADGNSAVQIRFSLGATDSAWQYSGWNIDDLVITGEGGGTPDPTITVISPNGGEDWELGTTHDVTWASSNTSGNVKLLLYSGGSMYNTISASTADDGSFSWSIPSGYTAGTSYTVRIEDATDSGVYDVSNSNFTLSLPPVPEITVTSPNGGEDWELSTTHDVTWASSNTSGNVKLLLYSGGSLYNTISASTVDDGSFSWSIPSGYAAGSSYTFRIEDVSDGAVFDVSNGSFTLSEISVADITTTPASFTKSLAPEATDSENLTIGNIGDASLDYTATFSYTTRGSYISTEIDYDKLADSNFIDYNPNDYPAPRQGGETIASAMLIGSLPFSDTGTTTGYTDDYDETCPYTGSTSPDVVYAFSPVTDYTNVDISLCTGSDYDTKLYVYENAETSGSPFACNDDTCPGYVSELPVSA